jgi:hypothetical protein
MQPHVRHRTPVEDAHDQDARQRRWQALRGTEALSRLPRCGVPHPLRDERLAGLEHVHQELWHGHAAPRAFDCHAGGVRRPRVPCPLRGAKLQPGELPAGLHCHDLRWVGRMLHDVRFRCADARPQRDAQRAVRRRGVPRAPADADLRPWPVPRGLPAVHLVRLPLVHSFVRLRRRDALPLRDAARDERRGGMRPHERDAVV